MQEPSKEFNFRRHSRAPDVGNVRGISVRRVQTHVGEFGGEGVTPTF
jgi:hypothetical protein